MCDFNIIISVLVTALHIIEMNRYHGDCIFITVWRRWFERLPYRPPHHAHHDGFRLLSSYDRHSDKTVVVTTFPVSMTFSTFELPYQNDQNDPRTIYAACYGNEMPIHIDPSNFLQTWLYINEGEFVASAVGIERYRPGDDQVMRSQNYCTITVPSQGNFSGVQSARQRYYGYDVNCRRLLDGFTSRGLSTYQSYLTCLTGRPNFHWRISELIAYVKICIDLLRFLLSRIFFCRLSLVMGKWLGARINAKPLSVPVDLPVIKPINMCTRFWCALFCCGCYQILIIYVTDLSIFFRVASQALGQSYDCPSAYEATLKDMGKLTIPVPNHDKSVPCAYFRLWLGAE